MTCPKGVSSDFIIDYFYFFNKKTCLGTMLGQMLIMASLLTFFHCITSYVMGIKFIFGYFINSSIVLVLKKLNLFFILLS